MWKISDFSTSVMWRNVKLIHMWRNFRFLLICHVQNLKFLHMTDFFSTDTVLVSVTNMRYAGTQTMKGTYD